MLLHAFPGDTEGNGFCEVDASWHSPSAPLSAMCRAPPPPSTCDFRPAETRPGNPGAAGAMKLWSPQGDATQTRTVRSGQCGRFYFRQGAPGLRSSRGWCLYRGRCGVGGDGDLQGRPNKNEVPWPLSSSFSLAPITSSPLCPPPSPIPSVPLTIPPGSRGQASFLRWCVHHLILLPAAHAGLSGCSLFLARPPPCALGHGCRGRACTLLGGRPALREAEATSLHWLGGVPATRPASIQSSAERRALAPARTPPPPPSPRGSPATPSSSAGRMCRCGSYSPKAPGDPPPPVLAPGPHTPIPCSTPPSSSPFSSQSCCLTLFIWSERVLH